jgi:hypothetical protein
VRLSLKTTKIYGTVWGLVKCKKVQFREEKKGGKEPEGGRLVKSFSTGKPGDSDPLDFSLFQLSTRCVPGSFL